MSAPESTRRRAPSMPRPARRPSADDKRALVERLLRAWGTAPSMRLGHLIANAMYSRGAPTAQHLASVEDETLLLIVELYASTRGRDSR